MLSPDFKEFLTLLNESDVKYLVVGGYAVGLHGYPRYTGDLDVWVRSTKENGEQVIRVLSRFGFGSIHVKAEDIMSVDSVVQLGFPPLRIDLVTTLDGVSFDECYERKLTQNVDGVLVHLISLEDLKVNKRATGRPRDLDDLENLK